jgi:DNA-directed RNA polymerase subunit F
MKVIALSVLLPLSAGGMTDYVFEDAIAMPWYGNIFNSFNSFNIFLQETKATLKQMGNVYSPEPKDANASLNKECVSNEYWQKIALLPDQQKNEALKKILKLNFTDDGYPLWRYHIAAAFSIAGVKPTDQDDIDACLGDATLFQDYALCKLLLEHGANPNGRHAGDAHLFLAKKRSLAELLIKHGAQTTVKNSAGWNLLMDSMYSGKQTEMITFYRSHGISPLDTDENNTTALHVLAFSAGDHSKKEIIERLSALLKDLSHNEIKQLIQVKQNYRGTVLDVLNQENKRCENGENAEFLQKYFESYLDVDQLDYSVQTQQKINK